MSIKENAGDSIKVENAGWTFAGEVSKNFEAHIARSVPFYHEGHELIAEISDFFLHDDSVCYDLGCSTGKLAHMLAERHSRKKAKFLAVDKEKDMAAKAKTECGGLKNVVILHSDLLDIELEKADLIISYYTMQFIHPKNRQVMFNRIFEALNWGGGFLLFEKVRGPDARFQDMMTSLYTDYKTENGFTGDEIITKGRSLKGVLEPFSTKGNLDLLARAGFADVMTVMKYICFEGFLAVK